MHPDEPKNVAVHHRSFRNVGDRGLKSIFPATFLGFGTFKTVLCQRYRVDIPKKTKITPEVWNKANEMNPWNSTL